MSLVSHCVPEAQHRFVITSQGGRTSQQSSVLPAMHVPAERLQLQHLTQELPASSAILADILGVWPAAWQFVASFLQALFAKRVLSIHVQEAPAMTEDMLLERQAALAALGMMATLHHASQVWVDAVLSLDLHCC